MKSIQPVSVWYNGTQKSAVLLKCVCNNDNLLDEAAFWWGIYSVIGDPEVPELVLQSGTISMSGQNYIDWNATPDINDAAYTWIADQLGLTII